MKKKLFSTLFCTTLLVSGSAQAMDRFGHYARKAFMSSKIMSKIANCPNLIRNIGVASKIGLASATAAGLYTTAAAYSNKQKADFTQQIKANEYSVNLMWINRKLDTEQLYIYPAKDETDLHSKFLNPIFKWSSITKEGFVNVWFDSEVTPTKAITKTKLLIKKYHQKYPKSAPILLTDVRELPKVQQNPEVFSDKTPVYFRADLLRVIAGIHAVTTNKKHHYVYADLDVKPLTKEELFDQATIDNINKYGMVLARGGSLGFENGFQIISHHNPNLISAMQWAFIELNIQRAKNALGGEFNSSNGRRDPKGPMKPLQQICYESYPPMFKYFYHLEGLGTLWTQGTKPHERILYNKDIHGLKEFGLNHFKSCGQFETLDSKVKYYNECGDLLVPTKKVEIPPAGLNYD